MNSISQNDTVVHRTGTTTTCVKKLPQHSCSTVQTRDLDRILGPEEREESQRLVKEPYDKWYDLGAIGIIGNIDGDRKD